MATPVEHPVPEAEGELRALPVDELQSMGRDDQDEWEYEYSTTETEVCLTSPHGGPSCTDSPARPTTSPLSFPTQNSKRRQTRSTTIVAAATTRTGLTSNPNKKVKPFPPRSAATRTRMTTTSRCQNLKRTMPCLTMRAT